MANNVNNGITGVIDIPGALRSRGAADGNQVGGVVAYTGDIYDVDAECNQAEINDLVLNSDKYIKKDEYNNITISEQHREVRDEPLDCVFSLRRDDDLISSYAQSNPESASLIQQLEGDKYILNSIARGSSGLVEVIDDWFDGFVENTTITDLTNQSNTATIITSLHIDENVWIIAVDSELDWNQKTAHALTYVVDTNVENRLYLSNDGDLYLKGVGGWDGISEYYQSYSLQSVLANTGISDVQVKSTSDGSYTTAVTDGVANIDLSDFVGQVDGGGTALTISEHKSGSYSEAVSLPRAIGLGSVSSGDGCVAFGKASTAIGNHTIAIGDNSFVAGYNSFDYSEFPVLNKSVYLQDGYIAIPWVTDSQQITRGMVMVFRDENYQISEYEPITNVEYGTYDGANTNRSGTDCLKLYYDTSHTIDLSVYQELSTAATGQDSICLGYDTVAANRSEVAVGCCNITHGGQTNAEKTMFSVGIGVNRLLDSTQPDVFRNAFEIMWDGSVYVKGLGSYDGTSISNVSSLQNVITDVNTRLEALTTKLNAFGRSGTRCSEQLLALGSSYAFDYTNPYGFYDNGWVPSKNVNGVAIGDSVSSIGSCSFATGLGSTGGNVTSHFYELAQAYTSGDTYIYLKEKPIGEFILTKNNSYDTPVTEDVCKIQSVEYENSKWKVQLVYPYINKDIAANGHVYPVTGTHGDYSSCFGSYTVAQGKNSTVVGKCNYPSASDIFSVGVGSGMNAVSRSNAVLVTQSGDVYIKGIGNYDGGDYTSAGVKSIQTVISELQDALI